MPLENTAENTDFPQKTGKTALFLGGKKGPLENPPEKPVFLAKPGKTGAFSGPIFGQFSSFFLIFWGSPGKKPKNPVLAPFPGVVRSPRPEKAPPDRGLRARGGEKTPLRRPKLRFSGPNFEPDSVLFVM